MFDTMVQEIPVLSSLLFVSLVLVPEVVDHASWVYRVGFAQYCACDPAVGHVAYLVGVLNSPQQLLRHSWFGLVLHSAVTATDWRFPESRKILKKYKIDHLGGSRGNTQKIFKKYKTDNSGGSRKNAKKDNRKYSKYIEQIVQVVLFEYF